MDIAPVGVQMTYANAANASQVQHNLNHEAALQQGFETTRQEKETELKQTQVQNKNDAEGGTIKDDPDRRSRGGGYYYRSSKRTPQEEDTEEDNLSVDYRKGRLLDISL
jgi:hypothetical protein